MVLHRVLLHPDGFGPSPGSSGPRPAGSPAPGSPAISAEGASKIRTITPGGNFGNTRHEDNWTRTPNTTGTGAIHVKTFHCKLSEDSLGYLDRQINEWLDAHPQYEVKFVQSSVGEWSGKLGKESGLIVQVWV